MYTRSESSGVAMQGTSRCLRELNSDGGNGPEDDVDDDDVDDDDADDDDDDEEDDEDDEEDDEEDEDDEDDPAGEEGLPPPPPPPPPDAREPWKHSENVSSARVSGETNATSTLSSMVSTSTLRDTTTECSGRRDVDDVAADKGSGWSWPNAPPWLERGRFARGRGGESTPVDFLCR